MISSQKASLRSCGREHEFPVSKIHPNRFSLEHPLRHFLLRDRQGCVPRRRSRTRTRPPARASAPTSHNAAASFLYRHTEEVTTDEVTAAAFLPPFGGRRTTQEIEDRSRGGAIDPESLRYSAYAHCHPIDLPPQQLSLTCSRPFFDFRMDAQSAPGNA